MRQGLCSSAALVAALALACNTGQPSEAPAAARPPAPAPEPLQPEPPGSWQLSVPEALQAGGATLSVSRLRAEQVVEEAAYSIAPGQTAVVLSASPGESLGFSMHAADGSPWHEADLLSQGCEAQQPGARRQLFVPRDYPTLQAAVDAAEAGDTVRVAAGVYRETVRLKSGVRLVGSGAGKTVLDGAGEARTLVEFTGARNVVISGFTFRNVGQGEGCAMAEDPLRCSGDWYAAGIYADGRGLSYAGDTGIALCPSASGLIVNNVFEGNDIALMLYFHARAAVRNNVFVGNHHGLVLNHFQDVALVANNVFWENRGLAIGNSAAYADIVNNVIARSGTGIYFEYIQQGRVRCNLFFDNAQNWSGTGSEARLVLGEDGNVEQPPRFAGPEQGDFRLGSDSPGRDRGCFGLSAPDPDGSAQDVGAHGGAFGSWRSTGT